MKPYTYLIGWSKQNLFYYGVRYAKGCDPDDLWKKYFTSSKRVEKLRAEFGEPDVIQIRRTFETKAKALLWEETVIRRTGAVLSESWVNMQNAGKSFNHNGVARDEKCRKKIREARLRRVESDPEFKLICQERARSVGKRADVRVKIGLKAKERYSDPSFRQQNIDTHNTPEYKSRTSKMHLKRIQNDPDLRERHRASINTPEYRELQSKLSAERMADPSYRNRISTTMKAVLSDPEKRKRMSEAARISSAKRIETRRRNMGEAGLSYGMSK